MAMSVAIRRYNRNVLGLSAIYAGALVGAELVFVRGHPTGVIAYLIAILPALPIIGIFAAIGRYLVDERDEYLRMLMIRQSLVASAFALTCATVWGFLESFGLVAHIEAFYVAVLWFGGLGLGSCVNYFTLGRRQ
ncbi:hypothetical protein [Sphingomonas oligophenolica]|uniref:Uncharacterized protein n=1 Tax=Sphingomonas oligophenolica TaxID=301154 RepID=A0A502CE66_9SPHN|nr:hypothetical protein [Sphingomonas oligophenolica]TPG10914.1 hypothetical protein EAH84_11560 [Sphingomonas oligophenolica]